MVECEIFHCGGRPGATVRRLIVRSRPPILKNIRIRTKLILGFGVIVAVLLFLLILAYQHSVRLYQANRLDKHTRVVIHDPQFDAVLQGMQSQAAGAMQISQSMGQLDDVSQHTLDSLKATSQAVQQLRDAAGTLQSSVANFVVAP